MKDKDKSAEGEERDINPPLEMEWAESYTDENLFEDTDLRLGRTEAELHAALLANGLAIPTTVAEVEFVERIERAPLLSRIAAVMEQNPDSCFIWVPVPDAVRDTIYEASGLPPDQLEDPSLCHITVVHAKLGDADEDAIHQEVAATLADLAPIFPQVTCTNSGLGYFDHEDQTVLWAPCSAPGLADLNVMLSAGIAALGAKVSRNHGFVPHMTVAYLPKGERPDLSYPEQKWDIEEIAVTTANREERYPLGKGQQMAAARLLASLGAPYDPQALESVCGAYRVPQSRRAAVQDQAIVLRLPQKLAADPYENIHGFDPSSFDAPTEESENMVQFAEDELPGGLAEGLAVGDFDPVALEKGTTVELEHVDDKAMAQEIAMDHLIEDPAYYDKLEEMEQQGQGQIDVPQDDNTYLDVDETRTDRAIPRGPTTEVL